MNTYKPGDKVQYIEGDGHVYTVIDVNENGDMVALSLKEYDDVEQDVYTDIADIKPYIITNHEMTDLIYDTLMSNGEMHELLDLNEVGGQEIEAHRGRISFTYKGRDVNITVS